MIIFLLWAVAFILKGILSYYILQYSYDMLLQNDLVKMIMIIVINLVTDIGPCLSVLEVKFIELFKMTRNEKDKHLTDFDESQQFRD